MFDAWVSGTGAYLPEKRVTNFDLEKMVDTSHEWILQRTGIRERRIADASEATSDLALRAAVIALERAELKPSDLGAIVLCTVTPDTYCPAGAVYLQRGLGVSSCAAFDLSAACTGFIYGMAVGTAFVRSGAYKNVLVVGAETLSRVVDFTDRNTCILFGDGAGAAVLSRAEGQTGSRIVDSFLCADGGGISLIEMPGGGSRQPASHESVEARQHYLRMQGKEVFKFATKSMVELIEAALERNRLDAGEISLVIPHQVNYRIIEAALKKIAIPEERMFLNLDRYGNTSAASVPIALHEAVLAGKLRRGDLVLLVAFGAGLTWGYSLIRW
jgi:3-oxoacyl-[acyl-carrier-protein] synthase-3